ncbi:unnamed protein product [Protopolystoma xenopodis]|uniref:Dynein light chain n=1 Tax=Protopolystoma xenopodis TaxID=117903 RepID=A0A3S5BPV6_9PLAT|nr:unnamed protein product [Protopolystoma xenopodis]
MDRKFGAAWHVTVGEGYGFEITHETKHLLYMFFGGNLAVTVWNLDIVVWMILYSDDVRHKTDEILARFTEIEGDYLGNSVNNKLPLMPMAAGQEELAVVLW